MRRLTLSVTGLLCSASIASAQCGLTRILPAPGFADSVAWAVSDNGVVAGASLFGPTYSEAFVWTEALGLRPLAGLGGADSEALGISSDGSTPVGVADGPGLPARPVAWIGSGPPLDLLAASGLSGIGEARDASADGSTIVGWRYTSRRMPFVWTAATGVVDLPLPTGANAGEARAVSDDGSVVVGSMAIGGQDRAFRWTAATGVVDIGAAGSGRGEAFGVSADGQVIVGWADLGSGVSEAFRWTAATGMTAPGFGLGPGSLLNAVSADGATAVGRDSFRVTQWSPDTDKVDLLPWINTGGQAQDISGEGLVVGYTYYGSFGETYAFAWRASPLGTTYCTGVQPNATGCFGRLYVDGSAVVPDNALQLRADELPAGVFGFFLAGRSLGQSAVPGSAGPLCLSGPIGRFNGPGQVQSTGAAGAMALSTDLTALPTPNSLVAAQPGETWMFQAWHRSASGAGSNFTDAVAVTLR